MKRKGLTAWNLLRMQMFLLGGWHGFWSWVAIERKIKKDKRTNTTNKEVNK